MMNASLMNSSMWNDSTTALVTHNGRSEGYDDVTTAMTTPVTPEAELTLTERLFLLTKTQRQEAEDALLYVRYVIFVMALPLTLCNVAVFLQPAMRGATAVFVIGLSLAQLLYVITSIIGRVMAAVIDDYFNDYTYLMYSIYVSSYVSIVVRRGSYPIMCYVSLERLYAILRPFHIKSFVLTRHPILFTCLTFVFAAAWNVFMLVKSTLKEVTSSRTGRTMHNLVLTDLYMATPEIADGFGAAAPVLMTYIPLLLLVALNVATVWALRRHNVSTRNVKSSTNEDAKRQRERQMTRTILVATGSYVILSLPYACHNLVKNIVESYDKRQKYENIYFVMRSLTFTLTLLSCAIDFLCFLLLSSSYRRTFFSLLRRQTPRGSKRAATGSDVMDSRTNSTRAETMD